MKLILSPLLSQLNKYQILPFSCCRWPAATRPAPWSECFYGDAGPGGYEAPPVPSSSAGDLKVLIQNDQREKVSVLITSGFKNQ